VYRSAGTVFVGEGPGADGFLLHEAATPRVIARQERVRSARAVFRMPHFRTERAAGL
jgi:hypothetical protein